MDTERDTSVAPSKGGERERRYGMCMSRGPEQRDCAERQREKRERERNEKKEGGRGEKYRERGREAGRVREASSVSSRRAIICFCMFSEATKYTCLPILSVMERERMGGRR